jgi:hypothetical protein
MVRGFAAQAPDCISAACGDIPAKAHPPFPLKAPEASKNDSKHQLRPEISKL